MDRLSEVAVALAAHAYPIQIGSGLLKEAGARIADLGRRHAIIISDQHVAPHYLEPLQNSLSANNITYSAIVLPPGEQTKSFSILELLTTQMIERGIERKSLVIALGGGVIGDLAGFAASIVLRGVDIVQMPTSLLAQVDSAVGGKTGIDLNLGKNLVGAFHQPLLVLADIDTLKTLPERQLLAGYAEIVKYGLIDDPAFFQWLRRNGKKVVKGEQESLIHAITQSCRNKARIVASDEKETGARALLNLGHTLAHALETEAGYDGRLLHGEAVAIGLHFAFALSVSLDLCPKEDLEMLVEHFAAMGLPLYPKEKELTFSPEKLVAHMKKDKKVIDGKIRFVLAHGIGKAFTGAVVEPKELLQFLTEWEGTNR